MLSMRNVGELAHAADNVKGTSKGLFRCELDPPLGIIHVVRYILSIADET